MIKRKKDYFYICTHGNVDFIYTPSVFFVAHWPMGHCWADLRLQPRDDVHQTELFQACNWEKLVLVKMVFEWLQEAKNKF